MKKKLEKFSQRRLEEPHKHLILNTAMRRCAKTALCRAKPRWWRLILTGNADASLSSSRELLVSLQ
jgi:hypothetical protein